MKHHPYDPFMKAGLIFIIGFVSLYFLTELVQFKIWWYFPLNHRWEYAITPSEGLKMGWYGKLIFCFMYSIPLSLMSFLLFKTFKFKSKETQVILDLLTLSSVLFTLYFMAFSMATRELAPLPEPLHEHESLHEF